MYIYILCITNEFQSHFLIIHETIQENSYLHFISNIFLWFTFENSSLLFFKLNNFHCVSIALKILDLDKTLTHMEKNNNSN